MLLTGPASLVSILHNVLGTPHLRMLENPNKYRARLRNLFGHHD